MFCVVYSGIWKFTIIAYIARNYYLYQDNGDKSIYLDYCTALMHANFNIKMYHMAQILMVGILMNWG